MSAKTHLIWPIVLLLAACSTHKPNVLVQPRPWFPVGSWRVDTDCTVEHTIALAKKSTTPPDAAQIASMRKALANLVNAQSAMAAHPVFNFQPDGQVVAEFADGSNRPFGRWTHENEFVTLERQADNLAEPTILRYEVTTTGELVLIVRGYGSPLRNIRQCLKRVTEPR